MIAWTAKTSIMNSLGGGHVAARDPHPQGRRGRDLLRQELHLGPSDEQDGALQAGALSSIMN